jgi:hypothetical protein
LARRRSRFAEEQLLAQSSELATNTKECCEQLLGKDLLELVVLEIVFLF